MNEILLKAFLQLKDFDEYMEKYPQFCGLQMDTETFRKEMELMERDAAHTHREKERIRDRKKRAAVRELHTQIETLMKEINRDGVWRLPVNPLETVEVRYLYPNNRQGDIDHYLAGLNHDPEEIGDRVFLVTFSSKEYQLIELMILPENRLFSGSGSGWKSPGVSFLLRHHRIAQIEHLMGKVNYYQEEYRSIRTIPNMALKKLLQEYLGKLNDKRDKIYEYLIGEGATNPRWKSEQKAYAIVREYYPDARFQYQLDFLYGQRLDIYIPSKKTAIEYQGKQHYDPIDYFGGSVGYKSNVERDRRKKIRCDANGIAVLYWDYNKPITHEFFTEGIIPQINQLQMAESSGGAQGG